MKSMISRHMPMVPCATRLCTGCATADAARKQWTTCPSLATNKIDTSERDAALWRAIEALPERCRRVFLLSKRDGLSHAEIADEMGISVKTVENQITKAYSRLRGELTGFRMPVVFLPFL